MTEAGALYAETLGESVRLRMHLNGWEFLDYFENGECVASGIHKGPEIHILVAPQWRGRALSRRRVREFLRPLFQRHGYLSTRLERTDTKNRGFIERLGFRKTWGDPMFNYFMMTALPFERQAPK